MSIQLNNNKIREKNYKNNAFRGSRSNNKSATMTTMMMLMNIVEMTDICNGDDDNDVMMTRIIKIKIIITIKIMVIMMTI